MNNGLIRKYDETCYARRVQTKEALSQNTGLCVIRYNEGEKHDSGR
jgi:hypothetical protein